MSLGRPASPLPGYAQRSMVAMASALGMPKCEGLWVCVDVMLSHNIVNYEAV